MKLGCSTVIFNQLDLYGALQHISWAGFDGAELSDIIPAQHIELNGDQAYIYEVKALALKHGLELFGINTEEVGEVEEDKIKSMTKVFDVALKLNIPIVAPYLRGRSGDKDVTKRTFKYLKKLSEQAESRGITLAISIHASTPVDTVETAIKMLNEIDSKYFGITLDTREICRIGEDPLKVISKIGKRIVHVHCRDYPGPEKIPPLPPPFFNSASGDYEPWLPTPELQIPGRGGVDFPKIIKLLKDVGYDKVVDLMMPCVLTYPLSRQMGIAAEARGYLNRCLQELR